MEHMVRKQIYIRKRQNILLKRQAKLHGVSEAEFIRRALEQELAKNAPLRFQSDETAFQKFEDFIQQHRRGIRGAPYQWKREDAYKERMQKLSPERPGATTHGADAD